MAITVPPVRGAGDLGHVDDSNTVRQALLDLDTTGSAHYPAKGDVHGFRWDETVGRRLFAWDAVNGREQMVYGDTGFRSFAAELLNGWRCDYPARLVIRRVGAQVSLYVGDLDASAATADQLWTIPAGFLPWWHVTTDVYAADGTPDGASLTAYGAGQLQWTGTRQSFRQSVITYLTGDPWPAVLPGTASGSIPTGLVMDTAELLPAGGQ